MYVPANNEYQRILAYQNGRRERGERYTVIHGEVGISSAIRGCVLCVYNTRAFTRFGHWDHKTRSSASTFSARYTDTNSADGREGGKADTRRTFVWCDWKATRVFVWYMLWRVCVNLCVILSRLYMHVFLWPIGGGCARYNDGLQHWTVFFDAQVSSVPSPECVCLCATMCGCTFRLCDISALEHMLLYIPECVSQHRKRTSSYPVYGARRSSLCNASAGVGVPVIN